ncbi:MAG: hypothetical protein HYY58_00385, partial [Candidatus Omnitrophica bacterium]|nr:hypothetical protein [Candidatus Omnitrophota bacterium]
TDPLGNIFVTSKRGDVADRLAQGPSATDVDQYEPYYYATNSHLAEGPGDEKAKEGILKRTLTAVRSAMVPSTPRVDQLEVAETFARLEETGILPLKIRLPKSGNVYRFNRLMTTQDALTLDATFVHLPFSWFPFAALGLLLLPVGGIMAFRLRRV